MVRLFSFIAILVTAQSTYGFSSTQSHFARPQVALAHPGVGIPNSRGMISAQLYMKDSSVVQGSSRVSKKSMTVKILTRTCAAFCALAFVATAPAFAAKSSSASVIAIEEHLHIGQKVAKFFQSFGLPDVAVLALISAMPVIELRGAIPVGFWMGLPITTVLPACVFGNMLPIIPLLYLLRNEKLKKLMSPILNRAAKKTTELGMSSKDKQWASLAAFVGIPLPGTGAWTGAMGAFLLDMPTASAISSIFAGVVSAGVIMSALTLAGKKGGIAALAILAIICGQEFTKSDKGKDSADK